VVNIIMHLIPWKYPLGSETRKYFQKFQGNFLILAFQQIKEIVVFAMTLSKFLQNEGQLWFHGETRRLAT
jgi:hypothetical protein